MCKGKEGETIGQLKEENENLKKEISRMKGYVKRCSSCGTPLKQGRDNRDAWIVFQDQSDTCWSCFEDEC